MKNRQTDIIIYKPKGKSPTVRVKLEADTLWLNLNEMSSLFHRDKSVISRHIRNIVNSGELQRDSVVAKLATTAADGKTYQVDYFNLDMIISVGYRVNSVVGTHFRIWATNVLRDYTVKGYAINKKRLKEAQERLDELSRSIRLIQSVAETRKLSQDETRGLLQVISDYAYGLKTLDAFDRRELRIDRTRKDVRFVLDYDTARKSIDEMARHMKKSQETVGLFGVESGDSLKGLLKSIHQTVGGKDAYPSVEEKAAHLLYFVIKDHPDVSPKL